MLICGNCGHAFETALQAHEPHPELDGCPSEIFCVCPRCGSGDIENARTCDICGEWYPVDALPSYGLCRKCLNASDERFKRLLSENFTAGEIEYLNDVYDGAYFGGSSDARKET